MPSQSKIKDFCQLSHRESQEPDKHQFEVENPPSRVLAARREKLYGVPVKANGLCGEEEMQSFSRMLSAGERSTETFASTTYLLISCMVKHSKMSPS